MSTTPEPRFEVPPEYAEVYERAYRRAYEQGLGVQPTSGTTLAPEAPRRGRRVAVPQQRRSPDVRSPDEPTAPRRAGARRADHPDPAEPKAPESVRPERRGHSGVPRTGSTWVPLLVLLALALMLIAGAFVLGRATAAGVGSLRSLGSITVVERE